MEKENSCTEADKGQGHSEFRMRELPPVFAAPRIEHQNSGPEREI